MSFFRKPTSPPLPLREGPPLISVFSPQGRRGNRPTRCSNRFAIRLADHQRSRQQRSCGLRYATAWIQIAYGLLGACSKFAWYLLEAFSKTHLDFLSINDWSLAPHALKGQKLLAQGNALGMMSVSNAPCKGKSFTYRKEFSSFIRCILKFDWVYFKVWLGVF